MVDIRLEYALDSLKINKKMQIVGGRDRTPDLQPWDPYALRCLPLGCVVVFVITIQMNNNI